MVHAAQTSTEMSSTGRHKFVMPGLVPGIHVLASA
jgi:hypothetical protein